MHAISYNNVKHYNLTNGASLPQWVSDKKQKELSKMNEKRRVELIQHMEFENGSPTCIRMTRDRNYMWIAGEYPAQLRCYDLNEVTMKFSRHVESQIVDMCCVTDDYKKIVLLERNRFIEFHSQGGRHARIRAPKEGRAIGYDSRSASVVVPTSSPNVYLFDCDAGCFREAITTTADANDCLAICESHPLLAVGGENGQVEFADLRTRDRVGILDAVAMLDPESRQSDDEVGITALTFDGSGMRLLAGTSSGIVGVFDLRKQTPLLVKDHNNTLPIRRIMTHNCFDKRLIASADEKGIKIWDVNTGTTFTTIDASHELYDFVIPQAASDRDSGVILAACDTAHVNSFFVPQLGPAPPWCSYLESITEELEETMTPHNQYEGYKYVTKQELEDLHLTHLLETRPDQIFPYMHGFYVDLQLYRTTKSVMDPTEYKDWKRQKLLEKKEAEDRITVTKKKKNLLKPAKEPVEDDRFTSKMDEDRFAVDKKSEAFLKYNPHLREGGAYQKADDSGDDSDGGSSGLSDAEPAYRPKGYENKPSKKIEMFELKEGRNILETKKESHIGRKREKQEKLTLGERLAKQAQQPTVSSKITTQEGGTIKQMSFNITDRQKTRRSNSMADDEDDNRKKRPKGSGKGGGKGKGKGRKGGKGKGSK
eukprot:TRINITY_DN4827_c0_g1_i1.p1 TRINITY_DN4827_c0_g1~~TRINITY_DN4827_c0_g1_i1.p1  ORF type:complete len:652 (+),score=145.30 TRINITY_DN4827_c0_g1_i1:76-2031(+)